jgi:chloramphenicol-sensitive protein RarD
MSQIRRGYLFGLGAYLLWGFFPIYFKLLRPAGALEILGHRILWSALFMAVLIGAMGRYRRIATLLSNRRKLAGIAAAAVVIAVNWSIYIYGVNSSRVVETSLGYFINPLIAVALGVLVLRERLRIAQWIALGIGAVSVAVVAADYGRLPWIALSLATSFALYGLIKKQLQLPPADALFVETALLTLPALAFLTWYTWGYHGHSDSAMVGAGPTFGTSIGHTVLILISGVLTAIPLMMFATAANSLPLTSVGMLQYLAPILQLLVGVVIYHEALPPARLVGFMLVWLALIVFTWDALRHAHRTARQASRRAAHPPQPVEAAVQVTV